MEAQNTGHAEALRGSATVYKARYEGKFTDKRPTRGAHPVHLFYMYRGYEYMVTDMHNGIDDLASQHRTEQNRIDRLIDDQFSPSLKTEPAEIGLNMFFEQFD